MPKLSFQNITILPITRGDNFLKNICLKVNTIVRLEMELTYYDVTFQ